MNTYLNSLIYEGEHQLQDFKYAINDSKKIARSLAAFSNTNGGRLLIGVKDNGSVVGVSSEEEYYMIEAAAEMYCRPAVSFTSQSWDWDGKTVLEINVPKSPDKPVSAPTREGKWRVFIRVKDQNLLANGVLLKVWRRQKSEKPVIIRYTRNEKFLLQYLRDHEYITMSKFTRMAHISYKSAERIMVNMVTLDLIKIVFTERQIYYMLNQEKDLALQSV